MSAAKRALGLRRLLRLIRILEREPASLDALAAALDVSTRTVRRDMDVLRDVGLPVWRSDATRLWQLGPKAPGAFSIVDAEIPNDGEGKAMTGAGEDFRSL